MSEGELEEEVTIEGRVVERVGAAVEDVVGEARETGELMEEAAGRPTEGRGDCILPGLEASGGRGGTATTVAGRGSSREEESKGEQGSSGCVRSAGSGEGTLWGEAIKEW